MQKDQISVKWTLFTQNHWKLYQMIWELVPEYYSKDLRLLDWSDEIDELEEPVYIKDLFLFSEKHHDPKKLGSTNRNLVPDMPEFWDLVFCFYRYSDSIIDLLPTALRAFTKERLGGDPLAKKMELVAKQKLGFFPSDKETRDRSMLVISLLQLAAAGHSLCFLMLFKYLHEHILLVAVSQGASSALAESLKMTVEEVPFNQLLEIPENQALAYEDLLQAVRLTDLCHLVLSSLPLKGGIIAKEPVALSI